ncbi:hypothetical protein AB0P36_22190 [Streptomyces flavidovirens]|uniref:hypothetical protein n=1 Tax=Streptomyces flavidovirens TaxID=67298 RepID=UPI00343EC085
MKTMVRPLFSKAVCREWMYGFLGAALSLPPLVVALVAAPPKWPAALRVLGFTIALCAVLLAMGFPRAARQGSVRLAGRMLGTDLPAPLELPASS